MKEIYFHAVLAKISWNLFIYKTQCGWKHSVEKLVIPSHQSFFFVKSTIYLETSLVNTLLSRIFSKTKCEREFLVFP